MFPKKHLIKYTLFILLVFIPLFITVTPTEAANPDGDLSIELIAAYNFVVDSNVLSPSTYAPRAGTIGAEFCNTGATPLEDVWAYSGNFATNTPGVYPSRSTGDAGFATEHPDLAAGIGGAGTYQLVHEGGSAGLLDASRYIGTIPPFECVTQYWVISYPNVSINGTQSVTGSIQPEDDLWLLYDIWATADDDGTPRIANQVRRATMRNEISAAANKIWPNGDNKVPQQYLDAIVQAFGWDTITPSGTSNAFPGELVTTQGIWYDFGVVVHGFDNNLDYVPDQNAWVQPVGDPSAYDPGCFRLVRTYGIVIVKLIGGGEFLIPFEDQLYFENLPDNRGVVGLVFYQYAALDGACTASLTPYQEVASGYDNEKFSGDYGTGIPPLTSVEPQVTLDKNVDALNISGAATLTYTLAFTNNTYDSANALGVTVGAPQYGVSLVARDTIPTGTQYVSGSADTINNTLNGAPYAYMVLYSTNNGATWQSNEPVPASSVTDLQWWMTTALPYSQTGVVRFQVDVPSTYSGSVVENTGEIGFGNNPPFAEDSTYTFVGGANALSGTVYEDTNSGANFANGLFDGGEPGISGATVNLYAILPNGDRLFWDSEITDGSGFYQFSSLPDGDYEIEVIHASLPLPAYDGWIDTSPEILFVNDLGIPTTENPRPNHNFGFAPALTLDKVLSTPTPIYEDQLVTYTINVNNEMPGNGLSVPSACTYTAWADQESALFSGSGPTTFTNPANAFDGAAPNNTYATASFISVGDEIAGEIFAIGAQPGTITKVEVLYSIYFNGTLVDDYGEAEVFFNGAVLGTIQNIPTATFNTFAPTVTQKGMYAWDITSFRAWSWADVNGDLDARLTAIKSGSSDSVTIFVDAIGLRVTSNQTCGGDNFTAMNPVPLVDTFDPTLLQFVSANPPANNVSGGTITWNNIGPIYGGGTSTITVTFRAIKQVTNAYPYVVNNTATVDNAYFVDGKPTNDDSDIETFNLLRSGSISGTIWSDTDADGWVLNSTTGYESPTPDLFIPNVSVSLYDCTATGGGGVCTAGTLVATTTSDANGFYQFLGLAPNDYYVVVNGGTPPNGGTQRGDPDDNMTAGGNGNWGTCGTGGGNIPCDNQWGYVERFTIGTNTWASNAYDYTNINFGYSVTASVFGNVWNNSNGDAVRDATEVGIGTVSVQLVNSGGTVIATVPTNANGDYQFLTVAPGDYTVRVLPATLPVGATWTQTAEVSPDVIGALNHEIAITVSASETSGAHNFGYTPSGAFTLGDTLFYDWDSDGTQDASDEGIPNIDVSLYRDNNNNGQYDPLVDAFIATTSTNATGIYTFPNLPTGNYVVVVNTNDPQFPTGDVNQSADPDQAGVVCSICNNVGDADIAGANNLTEDFGYHPFGTGTIGDTVWFDKNGDGTQSGTQEIGLPNVTVNLYADLNNDGVYALVKTTSTDANGNYSFTALPDGDYRVEVLTTDPDLPTDPFGLPYSPSTPVTVDTTITNANTFLNADFGFYALGAIGDTIFWDANRDGELDWNEIGVSGVVVELYADTNGDGNPDGVALTNDTTDAYGNYLFTGLEAGDYVVVVPTPPGILTADPDADGVECSDPSVLAECDNQTAEEIFVGTYFMGADFGYLPAGVIGDYVWNDQNGDGIQDPTEPGIAEVLVSLYRDTNNDGVGDDFIESQFTDFDGFYYFAPYTDDNYVVVVENSNFALGNPLNGYTQTADPDQAGVCSTCDNDGSATILGGNADYTVDFGYRVGGSLSLSGTICRDDASNDGICTTGGETLHPNIIVYLYTSTGTYIGQTTTLSNGSYQFNNLVDGTYVVSMERIQPPVDSATTALTTDASDTPATTINQSSTVVSQVVPLGGLSQSGVDFAYRQTVDLDFGDLPQTYFTLLNGAPNGARHIIPATPNLYLGVNPPDAEGDGAPSVFANGDDTTGTDDEDGVTNFVITADGAGGGSVDVVVNGSGWLVAWVDFNNDGDFADANELIINQAVGTSATTYTFNVPTGTFGVYNNFYTRFRIMPMQPPIPAVAYASFETNGETEDHLFVTNSFDLALTKVVTTTTPTAGQDVVFTITVYNQGNIPAHNVVVSDYIPSGWTLSVNNSATWADQGGGRYTTTIAGPIAPLSSTTVTIILVPSASGSFRNASEITSATDSGGTPQTDVDSVYDTTDGNAGTGEDPAEVVDNEIFTRNGGLGNPAILDEDDHDIANIVVITSSVFDIALDKTLNSAPPFTQGSPVVFNLVVTNQGTLPAYAIAISDAIPTGMTYSLPVASTYAVTTTNSATANITANGTGGFTIDTLNAGDSVTFTVTLTINVGFVGTSLTNVAEITSADDDLDTGNPPPTDFDSTPNNNILAEDDQDDEIIAVGQTFDIALDKTLNSAPPFTQGSPVVFNLVVTNQGTLPAYAIAISDAIPTGMTYSLPVASTYAVTTTNLATANITANGTGGFTIDTLNAGDSVTFTVTLTINVGFVGTSLTNVAQITSADDDLDTGNPPPTDLDSTPNNNILAEDDQDDEIIAVGQTFDLALDKTLNSAPPFTQGSPVVFNLVVTNQGTLPAYAIAVSDAVPTGMTYSLPVASTYAVTTTNLATANITANGTGGFVIDILGAGDSVTFTVTLTINVGFVGTSLTNVAEIMSADDDLDTGNPPPTDFDSTPNNNILAEDDQDDEIIAVGQTFDIALDKTLNSAPPFTQGSPVVFNLVVTNQGTLPAYAITIVDAVPTGMTYSLPVASTYAVTTTNLATANITANGTGGFTIDTLGAGDSMTFTVTLTINVGFVGTSLTNVAEITSADDDLDTGNPPPTDFDSTPNNNILAEDDQDDEIIAVGQTFDIALDKTLNSAPPFTQGSPVVFNLVVTNQGTLPAYAIAISDAIPTGMTYSLPVASTYAVTTTNSATANITANGTGGFTIDTLNAGDSVTFTVTSTINVGFVGTSLTNVAEITSADDDLDTGNPPPTDFDSTPNNNILAEDDQDDEIIAVGQTFDIALDKTLNSAPPFTQGSPVVFNLVVTNQGTLPAYAIAISDAIPTGMTYSLPVASTYAVTTTNSATANITANGTGGFTIDTLNAGDSVTFTVTSTINVGFVGTSLTNVAEITSADDDLDTGNPPPTDFDSTPNNNILAEDDQDDEIIAVGQTFDIALDKTLNSAPPFTQGSPVVFNLVVTNQGTLPAYAITIVDAVPTGMTYSLPVASTYAVTTTNLATANITANGTGGFVIDTLASGDSVTFTVTLTINVGFVGTSLTNVAEITSADDDLDTGNPPPTDFDSTPNNNILAEDDQDDEIIAVGQTFDIALDKTLNSAPPFTQGSPVVFNLVVTNQGTLPAYAITIVDAVPTGMTYSLPVASTYAVTTTNLATANITANGTGGFVIDTLASGDSVTFTVTLTINVGFVGTSLTNVAEITSADDDLDTGNPPPTDFDSTPNNNILAEDDQDDEIIAVGQTFDVALDKTLNSAPPFTQGSPVVFNLVVTNQGTLPAYAITIVDAVPTGMTYSLPVASTYAVTTTNLATANITANGTGGFVIDTLASGDSVTFTVTLTINVGFVGTSLTNVAEITSADDDLDTGNPPPTDFDSTPNNNILAEDDQDDEIIAVGQTFDVALDKTLNSAPPFTQGSPVVFNLVVTNQGTLPAYAITIVDAVPTGMTYSLPVASTYAVTTTNLATANITANGTGGFVIDTLASGDSVTFTVTLTINVGFVGTSLTNVAEITSADDDLDTGNPPPTDFDSTPNNNILAEDDQDDEIIPVLQISGLTIDKSANAPFVVAGESVIYTITITNTGPDLTNILFVDNVPTGVGGYDPLSIFWICQPSGGASCGNLAGTNAAISETVSMPTNSQLIYTITGTVPVDATFGSILNTAQIGAPTGPSDDAVVGVIFDPPYGTKFFNDAGLPELEWTQVWVNNRNTDAIDVIITDPIQFDTPMIAGTLECIPVGANTITQSCTESGGVVTWIGTLGADPTIPDGASAQDIITNADEYVMIRFRVQVPQTINQVFNQASASVDQNENGDFTDDDPVASDVDSNESVWTRTGTPPPSAGTVTIDKVVSSELIGVGDVVTWTITIANNSSTPVNNVVMTDTIPTELGIISVNSSRGTVNRAGQVITVQHPVLNVGETIIVTIETRVLVNIANPPLFNTAYVQYDGLSAPISDSAKIFSVMELPKTGETPWYRTPLLMVIGLLTVIAGVVITTLLRRYSRQ